MGIWYLAPIESWLKNVDISLIITSLPEYFGKKDIWAIEITNNQLRIPQTQCVTNSLSITHCRRCSKGCYGPEYLGKGQQVHLISHNQV